MGLGLAVRRSPVALCHGLLQWWFTGHLQPADSSAMVCNVGWAEQVNLPNRAYGVLMCEPSQLWLLGWIWAKRWLSDAQEESSWSLSGLRWAFGLKKSNFQQNGSYSELQAWALMSWMKGSYYVYLYQNEGEGALPWSQEGMVGQKSQNGGHKWGFNRDLTAILFFFNVLQNKILVVLFVLSIWYSWYMKWYHIGSLLLSFLPG